MKTVCICCPIGCNLTIKKENGEIIVTGNTCPRGKEYGKTEYENPKRVLTTSVAYENITYTLKSKLALPKELITKAVHLIKKQEFKKLNPGDTFISNILNTGVDITVTGVFKN